MWLTSLTARPIEGRETGKQCLPGVVMWGGTRHRAGREGAWPGVADGSTLYPDHDSTLYPDHGSTLYPDHGSTLYPDHDIDTGGRKLISSFCHEVMARARGRDPSVTSQANFLLGTWTHTLTHSFAGSPPLIFWGCKRCEAVAQGPAPCAIP